MHVDALNELGSLIRNEFSSRRVTRQHSFDNGLYIALYSII